MQKLALGLALLAALFSSSCKCAAEKKAVVEIESTFTLVEKEYLQYVAADAKLDDAQKDDRRKLIESYHRLVEALKNSLK